MEEEKSSPKPHWRARLASLTQRLALPVPSAAAATPALPAHLRSGQAAEDAAAALLQTAGLQIIARNYKTPGRGGGEIDLIARDGATLVFVEVRQRKNAAYGGAAASISATKRKRITLAAQYYLQRLQATPACRFDVVLIDGNAAKVQDAVQWLQAAFSADE